MDGTRRGMVRFVTSTSVWGLVACALGTSTILMPWRFYALLPAFGPEWQGLSATATWPGVVAAAAYSVAGLVLLATFSTDWVPAWKPSLLALAGVVGTACCGAYAAMSEEAMVEMFNRRMPVGVRVTEIVPEYHMLAYGFHVAVGCGVALLVLAAVQARPILVPRAGIPARGAQDAELGAAADGGA